MTAVASEHQRDVVLVVEQVLVRRDHVAGALRLLRVGECQVEDVAVVVDQLQVARLPQLVAEVLDLQLQTGDLVGQKPHQPAVVPGELLGAPGASSRAARSGCRPVPASVSRRASVSAQVSPGSPSAASAAWTCSTAADWHDAHTSSARLSAPVRPQDGQPNFAMAVPGFSSGSGASPPLAPYPPTVRSQWRSAVASSTSSPVVQSLLLEAEMRTSSTANNDSCPTTLDLRTAATVRGA
jgi:hypothetical protein